MDVAVDSQRRMAYVVSSQYPTGTLTAVDLTTGTVNGSRSLDSAPFKLAVDDVSGRVAVSFPYEGNNTVRVYDGESLGQVSSTPVSVGPLFLTWRPGGSELFVATYGTPVVLGGNGYPVVRSLPGAYVWGMTLDNATDRLYAASYSGGLLKIDASTGAVLATMPSSWANGGPPTSLALTEGGDRLLMADQQSRGLLKVNTSTMAVVGVVGGIDAPSLVAANPVTGRVFASSGTSTGGAGHVVELVPSETPNPLPNVSIGDAFVPEGDPYEVTDGHRPGGTRTETAHESALPLTLDEPSTEWTRVTYLAGNPGSATADYDYYTYPRLALIPPGETQVDAIVTTAGDTAVEDDETFTVTITDVVGATIGQGTSTVTVLDDDAAPEPVPAASIAADTVVDEGAGTAAVSVYLDRPSTSEVSLDWATSPGTAGAADFTNGTGTVKIPAGELSATIAVAVADDAVQESDENFTLTLTGAIGATLDASTTTVTISDNDTPPAIATAGANVSVTEGSGGSGGTATVTVLLDRPAPSRVEVFWATIPGSATDPSDFAAASGSVVFSAGQAAKTVDVPIVGDNVAEFTETLRLELVDTTGNVMLGARTSNTVSITDDDATPSLSVAPSQAVEGSAMTFTVSLSAASAKPVSVGYATSRGTTVATDFTAANGTLSFAPGTTTKTVTVATTADTIDESDETLFFNLSSNVNATLATTRATGTIIDNDTSTVTIANMSIAEGNTGTRSATFSIKLSGPSAQTVNVTVGTQAGTARSTNPGPDYQNATGTLAFAPGQTAKTFAVTIVSDRKVEPNETFRLVATAVSGAAGQSAFGTGTIVNDD